MRVRGDSDAKGVILNLVEGFRVLSGTNWVSRLSFAGLLGAAGFVLAFKDGKFGYLGRLRLFSGKEDSGDVSFIVPGLQNLGNNCFLNVILQALASCEDFQVFLQKVIEDSKKLIVEDQDEHLPLAFALSALLEELCAVGRGRAILSPHKVMTALALYVQNFNLTSQQDAAEAFLHLISSLREEFTDCYLPNQCTLWHINISQNLRIVAPRENQDLERNRWQKHFLGPFDGILGSMLICQTCSSQISLEFQFVHTLPLSPILDSGSNIMFGCTLEDCLKKFLVAEKVENYFCSRCWHAAAMKYLLVIGADKTDVEKIRSCTGDDLCDCKIALRLERLPWSNNFSHTMKQLSITRCPKVLCIQVQRALINIIGEPTKLRGHIAFPLVLDLSPFMTSAIGMNLEESARRGHNSLYQQSTLHFDGAKKFDAGIVNYLLGTTEGSGPLAAQPDPKQIESPSSKDHFNAKVSQQSSSNRCLYRLVAVVEHFGRTGGGHYTVYRSMKLESHSKEEEKEEDCDDHSENLRWFGISDSEVSSVSEKDVLGAEASLLFYERLL